MIPPHVEPQSQQEQQPAEAQAEEGRAQGRRTGGKVVHMHTAHAKVPIPYVTPGDMFSNVRTATSTATSAATSLLPSPRKLAFYGVLGGMTAAGAIGWPVAVAVGAATEVVTREQAARQREEHERVERERAEREQGRQSATEQTQPERPARTATA
ncbi:hypothetical protein G5C60_03585 [Streptomyces sp. HC44]|uniref:Uncharacterized protein n=1 Tax=Streptomyces scabichelini TaxID=2711217 RepID=A0A6G4UYB3_9ACTN|nr:hypothetical protein [Streptomyces scabichelini]NGO06768.1 hypothetical protein [Streptomyces scabichelini]